MTNYPFINRQCSKCYSTTPATGPCHFCGHDPSAYEHRYPNGRQRNACEHGYHGDCSICDRHDGQCSWGSCEMNATCTVEYVKPDGSVLYARAYCNRHESIDNTISRMTRRVKEVT